MQTTGMPMRPAMSTMMAADIPPTEAADTGLDVQLHVPDDTRAGVPTRVTATVVDAETGEPVEDLTSHQAWMHLIATRDDLATFAHVHPEPTGRPGELAVEVTFPTPGRYIVNTEFRQRGQMADVHQRQLVTVAGVSPAPVAPETPRVTTVDGVTVELGGEARVGERSDLHFAFTDARTGRPIDDLQPFLAAAGHVVVMRADGATFAHEHAEVEDDRGRLVLAMPGRRSAPSSMCTPSSTLPAPTRCGASSDSPTARCSRCRSPSRRPDPHRRHRPASPRGPVATRQRSSGGEMYDYDVVVIGAGQAGLATGYELGKTP